MASNICKECKSELKPGARFCTRCGTKVDVEDEIIFPTIEQLDKDPLEKKINIDSNIDWGNLDISLDDHKSGDYREVSRPESIQDILGSTEKSSNNKLEEAKKLMEDVNTTIKNRVMPLLEEAVAEGYHEAIIWQNICKVYLGLEVLQIVPAMSGRLGLVYEKEIVSMVPVKEQSVLDASNEQHKIIEVTKGKRTQQKAKEHNKPKSETELLADKLLDEFDI